ncbi:MAG: ATP-binding domain-containing protein [Eubacteriales bacterium]
MESASELEHAYAITVHKSQGNEFPAVIMPMFPGPPQFVLPVIYCIPALLVRKIW